MSNERTLDQMLAEIDNLLNEEDTADYSEERPIVMATTLHSIPSENSERAGQVLENMGSSPTIPNLPPLGPLPECRYSIIRLVMNHANHPYVKIQESARRLGITEREVREIRRSKQYLEVVKARINRNSREGLIARIEHWETRIDKVYSKYFGVSIIDIRHILESIFPGWSEMYNDR